MRARVAVELFIGWEGWPLLADQTEEVAVYGLPGLHCDQIIEGALGRLAAHIASAPNRSDLTYI